MNIFEIENGQEIIINKHGEIINTTFKFYRQLTVRTAAPTFEIHTDAGMIWAGANGEPVHYNDYSTFIVGK